MIPTIAAPAGPARLLALVQLCDSALPIGAYSHSWGLEAAIDRGRIDGPVALESWVHAWLTYAPISKARKIINAVGAGSPDFPRILLLPAPDH